MSACERLCVPASATLPASPVWPPSLLLGPHGKNCAGDSLRGSSLQTRAWELWSWGTGSMPGSRACSQLPAPLPCTSAPGRRGRRHRRWVCWKLRAGGVCASFGVFLWKTHDGTFQGFRVFLYLYLGDGCIFTYGNIHQAIYSSSFYGL